MGPNFIPLGVWANFKNILDKAYSDFGKKTIVYYKVVEGVNLVNEDNPEVPEYTTQDLEVLLNYNYMRTWPITVGTESGELDKQSIQILMNKEYLRSLDLLSPTGNFTYNPALDRFLIDGQLYKAAGDTAVSQANADDILFSIVVKREEHTSAQFVIR